MPRHMEQPLSRHSAPADLKTTFTIPTEATADVSLRRLQALRVAPGESVRWKFGAASGEAKADASGCVTVPGLKITAFDGGQPPRLRFVFVVTEDG